MKEKLKEFSRWSGEWIFFPTFYPLAQKYFWIVVGKYFHDPLRIIVKCQTVTQMEHLDVAKDELIWTSHLEKKKEKLTKSKIYR